MTAEDVVALISEEADSKLYHLSLNREESLCGCKNIVPTRLGIESWNSMGEFPGDSCQACHVRMFGFSPALCSIPNHPLYIACRILDLYSNRRDFEVFASGVAKGDSVGVVAAVKAIICGIGNGIKAGADMAENLWLQISDGRGRDYDIAVKKILRRIFADFMFRWK